MTGARTWKSFVFFARQRERVAAQLAAVQLMVCQRTGSREDLRRRGPPPCIPRPIRLGGYPEHGGERGLRLARHSRSVRGSTTSHHAIGAGRREARKWRGAYFSQPIVEGDRSLFSPVPSLPAGRGLGL